MAKGFGAEFSQILIPRLVKTVRGQKSRAEGRKGGLEFSPRPYEGDGLGRSPKGNQQLQGEVPLLRTAVSEPLRDALAELCHYTCSRDSGGILLPIMTLFCCVLVMGQMPDCKAVKPQHGVLQSQSSKVQSRTRFRDLTPASHPAPFLLTALLATTNRNKGRELCQVDGAEARKHPAQYLWVFGCVRINTIINPKTLNP